MALNRILCLVLLFLWILPVAGQVDRTTSVTDSLYREDQFYLGFTYNLLSSDPDEISGPQFSGGIHLGFIRDMPLNERRNLALGAGLGWSINTYGQNLFIGEEAGSGNTIFQLLDRDEMSFDTNRFTTQSVDLPLQLRWRTSTPDTYKFWRIYGGIRPSYIYYFRSNFVQPGNQIRQTQVPEFNRLRWGATLTVGYNTFNFHFYYSLNSFFDEAGQVNGTPIDLKTFQVGLMFYLL